VVAGWYACRAVHLYSILDKRCYKAWPASSQRRLRLFPRSRAAPAGGTSGLRRFLFPARIQRQSARSVPRGVTLLCRSVSATLSPTQDQALRAARLHVRGCVRKVTIHVHRQGLCSTFSSLAVLRRRPRRASPPSSTASSRRQQAVVTRSQLNDAVCSAPSGGGGRCRRQSTHPARARRAPAPDARAPDPARCSSCRWRARPANILPRRRAAARPRVASASPRQHMRSPSSRKTSKRTACLSKAGARTCAADPPDGGCGREWTNKIPVSDTEVNLVSSRTEGRAGEPSIPSVAHPHDARARACNPSAGGGARPKSQTASPKALPAADFGKLAASYSRLPPQALQGRLRSAGARRTPARAVRRTALHMKPWRGLGPVLRSLPGSLLSSSARGPRQVAGDADSGSAQS